MEILTGYLSYRGNPLPERPDVATVVLSGAVVSEFGADNALAEVPKACERCLSGGGTMTALRRRGASSLGV